MAIDPELLAMMTQTILIQNPAPYAVPTASAPLDIYGRHDNPLPSGDTNTSEQAWLSAVSYLCRIEFTTKVFTDAEGRERKSSGQAYLTGFFSNISTESKVCIPSQVQPALRYPVIAYIDNNYDESGPYSTTIHFQ